jgi:hypothetical protein
MDTVSRAMKRTGAPASSPQEVGRDTALRSDDAAALAYLDRSMTASGLRREHNRGRLIIERTAGKNYTMLAYIERTRELCRAPPKESGSGCALKSEILTARSAVWDIRDGRRKISTGCAAQDCASAECAVGDLRDSYQTKLSVSHCALDHFTFMRRHA